MNRADLVVSKAGARFMGRFFPCSVGRGGIVAARDKREGDGATPDGVHTIVGMLYNPARIARPVEWAEPVSHADRWSDDSRDANYNAMVRMPHGFGHERLWRADPLYDLVLLTDWNWPDAVPGRGSAIFLHQWRRPRFPTAGCVAFARTDLRWIAERITFQTRLIIRR